MKKKAILYITFLSKIVFIMQPKYMYLVDLNNSDLHILFQMVEYVDAHFKTTNSSCSKANRRTHRCTDGLTD